MQALSKKQGCVFASQARYGVVTGKSNFSPPRPHGLSPSRTPTRQLKLIQPSPNLALESTVNTFHLAHHLCGCNHDERRHKNQAE